jgi:hypothetical protein
MQNEKSLSLTAPDQGQRTEFIPVGLYNTLGRHDHQYRSIQPGSPVF